MATKKKTKKKSTKKKAKRKPRDKALADKEVKPSKLLEPAESAVKHYDPRIEDLKDQSHLCVIPAKRPIGRPSLYEPKFCEMLINHMAAGFSFESFAGVIGTTIKTIYNWASKHPEFLHAKERGSAACRHWWENAGITSMGMPTKAFNSTVWSRNMNARFPDTWRSEGPLSSETDEDEIEFKVEFG